MFDFSTLIVTYKKYREVSFCVLIVLLTTLLGCQQYTQKPTPGLQDKYRPLVITAASEELPTLYFLFNPTCPVCADSFDEVLEELLANWVKTNRLNLHFVPMKLTPSPDEEQANLSLLCVAQQGSFTEYLVALTKHHGILVSSNPEGAPTTLDQQTYQNCLADPGTRAFLATEYEFARQFHEYGVPTLYYSNKQVHEVLSAHDYDVLREKLEELVARSE